MVCSPVYACRLDFSLPEEEALQLVSQSFPVYNALYSALNLVAEKKRILVLGGALSLSPLAV